MPSLTRNGCKNSIDQSFNSAPLVLSYASTTDKVMHFINIVDVLWCSTWSPYLLAPLVFRHLNSQSFLLSYGPWHQCFYPAVLDNNSLFSWGIFLMILIMSFPILLWSLKLMPYLLVGFWRLWLFNYPLSFTLTFPTLNPMDWHDTKGVPSLGFLRIHVQNSISIGWGSPKILSFHYGY